MTDIDGFDIGGTYIKKNKNGFYELQQWVEKPIEEQDDEEEADEDDEEQPKPKKNIKMVINPLDL